MSIVAKINARKVVLVYFYARLVLEYVFNHLEELVKKFPVSENDKKYKYENIIKNLSEEELAIIQDLIDSQDIEVDVEKIVKAIKDDIEDVIGQIEYIIRAFFYKVEVDKDYALKIAQHYDKYEEFVRKKVDELAKTFKFDEMDFIDRAIFLLGYIEYKELGVDKPLVLNEMVELAKRYGDEGSYRLINGIGEKLLND